MGSEHTAEHIFVGSLSRLIQGVKVKKVEHTAEGNFIYLICDKLNWDTIWEAERITNKVISEGRVVKEHFFNTLDEAKKVFPTLRAYEERISGKVRVIEIDGYDYSACNREHVNNTKECDFFLITGFSKAHDGTFQITFEVGERAKVKALEISNTCMKVAEILGATYETLVKTASNISNEVADLRRKIRILTLEKLNDLTFVEGKGFKFYHQIFEGLDRKILMKKIGELIKGDKVIVLIGNMEDQGLMIFARSYDINIDCSKLLQEALVKFGGRGGGKPEYAFGSVDRDRFEEAFTHLKDICFSALNRLTN
ncbi:MAG: DHHA1 domain-containing protein [Nitrososphaerota archaeon]|nr:DHHA1 domain-containing protein [Nitrososphaerales archaeon]MDW8044821.1 DHHA1 domain-containing protein [Nitrososphaerota archaeon]